MKVINLVLIAVLLCFGLSAYAIDRCEANLSLRAVDSVRISNFRASTFAEFLRSPKMDGSVPFPVGETLKFDMRYPGSTDAHHVAFKIDRISNLPRTDVALTKDLKYRSKPMTPDEIEMNGFLVEYEDGSVQGIKTSSGRFRDVSGADASEAINKSGILKNGKIVKRFLHIHTHPDPRNPLAQVHDIRNVIPSGHDLPPF